MAKRTHAGFSSRSRTPLPVKCYRKGKIYHELMISDEDWPAQTSRGCIHDDEAEAMNSPSVRPIQRALA